ncbi:MAG TPA: hypothetical protein VIV83_07035, partial [Gemmatimonadales bacterium]
PANGATGVAPGSSARDGAASERIATTVISAPNAAPASPQGSPARHPVAPAVPTAAPHLWQNLAVGESEAPQA